MLLLCCVLVDWNVRKLRDWRELIWHFKMLIPHATFFSASGSTWRLSDMRRHFILLSFHQSEIVGTSAVGCQCNRVSHFLSSRIPLFLLQKFVRKGLVTVRDVAFRRFILSIFVLYLRVYRKLDWTFCVCYADLHCRECAATPTLLLQS